MIKIAIILLTSLIPISVEISSLSLKFLKLICRFLICHYSGNLDICPGSVPLSEFYNDIPIVEWFNLNSYPPTDVNIIFDLENGTSEFFGGNSFIDYNVFCSMYTRNLHRLQNSSQIMPFTPLWELLTSFPFHPVWKRPPASGLQDPPLFRFL